MKIYTGIIMILGVLLSLLMFMLAKSAPQEASAVVPAVIAYIFGRALENFDSTQILRVLKEISYHLKEQRPNLNQKERIQNPVTSPVEKPIDPWTCTYCSRENTINEGVCEKCGKSRSK